MKTLLFSAFLAGFALSAYAEAPGDVCAVIAASNPGLAQSCVSEVGNNKFDAAAVDVCAQIQKTSSYDAITCLNSVANHHFDPEATKVCGTIALSSGYQAQSCLTLIQDKNYPNGIAAACAGMARNDAFQAISCLSSNGTTASLCPANADVVSGIRSSLKALDDEDIATARKILSGLAGQLDGCQ